MPVAKKQIVRKSAKTTESVKKRTKTGSFDEVVLFPEKVNRMNDLLNKAVLLPQGKNKK